MLAAATTNSSGPATGLSEAVAALVRDSHNPDCPDTALVELLRSVFKHKDFRGPQLGVIRRVLRGESTLAILPTGAASPSPSRCRRITGLLKCRGIGHFHVVSGFRRNFRGYLSLSVFRLRAERAEALSQTSRFPVSFV